MRFTKMHGLGNDYVYVNTMTDKIANPSELAKKLSDRHFGIGADGLILITPSTVADVGMEMYNADGSRGMMCGNGIRCVAKYVYDAGIVVDKKIYIETISGIKETNIFLKKHNETHVEVNMGAPEILRRQMETTVGIEDYKVDYLSMGNPHAVVWLDSIQELDIQNLGPQFENHAAFDDRVNTEFAHAIDRKTVEMRVWERGSGETFACGTGACATAVSGVLNNLTEREVTIKLLGGDLLIKWSKDNGNVYMTGPAETVFEGEIKI